MISTIAILPDALDRSRDAASAIAALDRAVAAGLIDQREHAERLRLLLRQVVRRPVVTKGAA